MDILPYPHPALRRKSEPVMEINQHLRDIVAEMFRLMYASRGIGLAANQVGLPYRVFVINPTGDSSETDQEFVFLNPEIINRKGSEVGEEGCLSFPKLYGDVQRPADVRIAAYDLDGQGFEMTLSELPARVVQHEGDHLDGVLFIDHVPQEDLDRLSPDLERMEQEFRARQESGELPSDDELQQQLDAYAKDMSAYPI